MEQLSTKKVFDNDKSTYEALFDFVSSKHAEKSDSTKKNLSPKVPNVIAVDSLEPETMKEVMTNGFVEGQPVYWDGEKYVSGEPKYTAKQSTSSCSSSAFYFGVNNVEMVYFLRTIDSLWEEWAHLENEARRILGNDDNERIAAISQQVKLVTDESVGSLKVSYDCWQKLLFAISMIRDRMQKITELLSEKSLPDKLEGLDEPNVNGTRFKYLMVDDGQ